MFIVGTYLPFLWVLSSSDYVPIRVGCLVNNYQPRYDPLSAWIIFKNLHKND